ncbi:MAG: zinc-finger domain-containing protein [Alphaproteobacteria bacterium]|uniref:zinc-finger domain-containing protein n=1 Tax=Brevundimonas sp. TaxID=1871086 RepID=UPI001D5579C9|nr:zinc-finger domain-containing protein [Alphaproteobacteria bacterium]MBU2232983.1 zinc-finger domain-containing protein [Alphaproteobacteria bacterium]MBU2349437.1 zinc-finger domain-containing protein [Alphaproteobacteria bacterium]MBU2400009.1 zinc-finger domain-containing protein [Alphaproteobacteria bacterium]
MPPRHPDAIIPPPEEVVVSTKRVACDGGGALGHPLVYMDMGEDDFIECGYCDRRFVLSADPHDESEYLSPAARAPEAH